MVKDALTAYRAGGVHAMHDPTEGGILNGIHELADAAGLGVRVFEEKIAVEPETAKICRFYEIDPLQLISSGALLIAAEPEAAPKIIESLSEEHIYADVIGEFNPNPNKRILMHKDEFGGDAAQTRLRPPVDRVNPLTPFDERVKITNPRLGLFCLATVSSEKGAILSDFGWNTTCAS